MAGSDAADTGTTARADERQLADFKADPRLIMLSALALMIGTGGAFAAWLLVKLIVLVTNLVWFGAADTVVRSMGAVHRGAWTVAAPVLGGLVIGLMARFGSEKIRGHGIPEAIEAILIGGSRMSPKVAVLKPIASAVSIGTGGPFGAEGPIIMTGGAIGSLLAQFFDLSAAERKALLVAGAAAGMTGIFGTPVAAVLLAVELLLFEWRPRSFVPVVAAAMAAICWRPLLFGSGPLFPYAADPAQAAWGIGAAGLIGLAAGLVATGLTKLLYACEDVFEHLPVHWMWWPAIGGVAVGLGGLIEPRALGVGYDVIADLLSGHMLVGAVALILAVKAAIWLIALSSGTSGGVLAPLLILGGGVGWLIGLALPGEPGFWALIGMAAMLGGTMRAPLTGALFAVELTGDLKALPALLAATAVGYAVTVLLLRRSMLTEKIARRGQHITREYGIDPFELTRVGDIMARGVDALPADMPVDRALEIISAGRHRAYPVLDDAGRPVGLATRADALRWSTEGVDEGASLEGQLSDAAMPVLHPGDTASHAADAMLRSGGGRLTVTDPTTGQLVGIVTRRDLLQVRAGVVRGETERSRPYGRKQRRLMMDSGVMAWRPVGAGDVGPGAVCGLD